MVGLSIAEANFNGISGALSHAGMAPPDFLELKAAVSQAKAGRARYCRLARHFGGVAADYEVSDSALYAAGIAEIVRVVFETTIEQDARHVKASKVASDSLGGLAQNAEVYLRAWLQDHLKAGAKAGIEVYKQKLALAREAEAVNIEGEEWALVSERREMKNRSSSSAARKGRAAGSGKTSARHKNIGLAPLVGVGCYANSETMEAMLSIAKCDPNGARCGIGWGPLHAVATFSRGNKYAVPKAQLLLENRADINARCCMILGVRSGPFQLISHAARLHVSLWGLERSAVKLRFFASSAGITPLGLAAMMGDHALVKLLLSFDADPKICNERGDTPADLALVNGPLESVENSLEWQGGIGEGFKIMI
eukprot:s291_g28.t1